MTRTEDIDAMSPQRKRANDDKPVRMITD